MFIGRAWHLYESTDARFRKKMVLLSCISLTQESCSVAAGVMEKVKRKCIADNGIRIRTAFDSTGGTTDARSGVGYYYYVAAHCNATPNRWNTLLIEIT
jgi:hypothetical protein